MCHLRVVMRAGLLGSLLLAVRAEGALATPPELLTQDRVENNATQEEDGLIEPCTLLVVGTGVISAAVLRLRKRSRIPPDLLIDAHQPPLGPDASVMSRT